MIGIPLALFMFNAGEWAAHKYLLHDRGKDKRSAFAFHFHGHHQSVRRNGMYDPDYEGPVWSTTTQAREAIGLAAIGLLHAPLFPVAPFYVATTWWCLDHYRRVHKRAHVDPEWGRRHLPWHYDHHMGPNQDRNWCVVWPWFDDLVGTRRRFVGTAKELADRVRTQRRASDARISRKPPRRTPVPLDVLFGLRRRRPRAQAA
jgi:sterol desaturase/sphingolipid hydroxylase (fatty acid hydroxylase superfamily)